MSRVIDLRKPLEEVPREDLQYALDRYLISQPTERARVIEFLTGEAPEVLPPLHPGAEDDPDNPPTEPQPADTSPLVPDNTTGEPGPVVQYDPTEYKVDEVLEHAAKDSVSAEDVEEMIRLEEASDKPRTTLIEGLRKMLPDDDE